MQPQGMMMQPGMQPQGYAVPGQRVVVVGGGGNKGHKKHKKYKHKKFKLKKFF